MSEAPTQPSIEDQERQQQQAMVVAALRNPGLRMYANGFAIANTASDMSVILMLNGTPAGVLNLSYISAKSLISSLTQAVTEFEKAISQDVMTIEEIQEKLPKGMVVRSR
jgi:hypothetical protein